MIGEGGGGGGRALMIRFSPPTFLDLGEGRKKESMGRGGEKKGFSFLFFIFQSSVETGER